METNFYSGEYVTAQYDDICDAYILAFAGDPWFEAGRCADAEQRCSGGFSALTVGQTCEVCKECISEPAYTKPELVARFEMLRESRSVSWYLAYEADNLALAALAWPATAEVLADEKYSDEPDMRRWLAETLRGEEVVWLDDIFANKQVKPSGNLSEFRRICQGLGDELGLERFAFRTITEQMISAIRRDFGEQSDIILQAPDSRERSFVLLDLGSV